MSLFQPVPLFLSPARSKSVMTGELAPASARPASPNPLERPLKIGWLKKQRSIVKNWQQRYFVLKGQQLYYYKDEDDAKPQVRGVARGFAGASRPFRGRVRSHTGQHGR